MTFHGVHIQDWEINPTRCRIVVSLSSFASYFRPARGYSDCGPKNLWAVIERLLNWPQLTHRGTTIRRPRSRFGRNWKTPTVHHTYMVYVCVGGFVNSQAAFSTFWNQVRVIPYWFLCFIKIQFSVLPFVHFGIGLFNWKFLFAGQLV